jgi:hypothetical protein
MFFFIRSNLHEWLRRELGLPEALRLDPTLLLILLGGAIVMGVIASRIARIPANYRRYDPDEYDARFNGIGGTLLITAALVSLEPIRLIVELFIDRFLLSSETHDLLGGMGEMGNFWLMFNATATGIRIVFALLLVWLFYRRKRIFRVATIGYLSLNVLLFLLHDFILTQIFTANNMAVFENFAQVTRSMQVALLSTPYILFARRINATLRE